jgi:lipopolysaccharide biosynthesis protein
LLELPFLSKIVVTTTSHDVKVASEAFGAKFKVPFKVMQFPNRGRNFGPLFEVMAKIEPKYDFLLHIHGKKSLHTNSEKIMPWTDALYTSLLKPSSLGAALRLMQADEEVAVTYPDVTKFVSRFNLCWGMNFEPVSEIAFELGISKPRFLTSRLNFPAGGMFLIRLGVYQDLFASSITQQSFSVENGSVDGMLEHGLERLFGAIADNKGMYQVALDYVTGNHVKMMCRGNREPLARLV